MPEHHGPYGYDDHYCPACKSTKVTWDEGVTTLVGWVGGPERNPNHHTGVGDCQDCGLHFTREHVIAHRNAWCAVWVEEGPPPEPGDYRTNSVRYCIAGMPSCCDTTYRIPCPQCGKWIQNDQRGQTVSSRMVNDVWVSTPSYRWACGCGFESARPIRPDPV